VITTLRRRRYELELSQDQLAERVACSQGAISAWEIGKATVRERRHRKMLEAIFDCPLSELLEYDKEAGVNADLSETGSSTVAATRRKTNRYVTE
jgi:transcriptional regulator with XRE-family HTH domain